MITQFTKQEYQNVTILKKFGTRTENFKGSLFFSFCVNEWYKLDISWRKAENVYIMF